MSTSPPDPDRLYRLLPAYIRERDVAAGEPLRALLQVIAEQVSVVDDDLWRLYRNWFIETCDDWAVPYIADLVDYRPVTEAGLPGAVATREGRLRNRVLISRRDVADTIRDRRRKGTLGQLNALSGDVAGWPSRAVEFAHLLAFFQNVDHLRPARGGTVDLRNVDALDRIDGPFDSLSHTVDVRRPDSTRTPGLHNIPSVGVYAWTLQAFPLERAPTFHHDQGHPYEHDRGHPHPHGHGRGHGHGGDRPLATSLYSVSVLGNEAPLYARPLDDDGPSGGVPDEPDLPVPIRRRAFAERIDDYYGAARSLLIFTHSLDNPVPIHDIVPADLEGRGHSLKPKEVAVDPELGLIALAHDPQVRTRVWVSYRYGFSAPMGGGGYPRALAPPGPGVRRYLVSAQGGGLAHATETVYRRINDALKQWDQDDAPSAIIEILDSDEYPEELSVAVPPGVTLELRATSGARPLLRFRPYSAQESDLWNESDVIRLLGTEPDDDLEPPTPDGTGTWPPRGGRIVLDGLLIAGRYVEARGYLSEVVIRHCTLVPGWSLDRHCQPAGPGNPSLHLADTTAAVVIERSILGPVRVEQGAALDPVPLRLTDSILDAMDPDGAAMSGPEGCEFAQATLTIVRSTVVGGFGVHAIALGENSIFTGEVRVARSQFGCLRFCYTSPTERRRTPRRFECQPDVAVAELTPPVTDDARRASELRVKPRFTSLRYGTPTYGQLARSCPDAIRRGADDESEMGAFHDLFKAQREANLRARIDEYTPAGMNPGLFLDPGDKR
jgi:hypothetical protein